MSNFCTEPPKLENIDRCAICGIIIGDYRQNNKLIKVKYKYPIAIRHNKELKYIDVGCYLEMILYPSYHPKFDADKDKALIN